MYNISQFLAWAQATLFPHVQDQLGPLTDTERELTQLLEFIHVEDDVRNLPTGFRGQQPCARKPIARAFVAKAFLGMEKTCDLINFLKSSPNLRRICGWERPQHIPSEATFSRAFAEFAASELPQRIHKALIRKHYHGEIVGHVSRDSTAINAREKAANKPPKKEKSQHKRGRPKKDEVREEKETKRLTRQITQSTQKMLSELPKSCDWGCKTNSKGKIECWRGYKLHLDVADSGIILTAIVTSASLHDSQAAIPLMLETSLRVDYLYDVMDAAYDAKEIREYSSNLGHIPIIDPNNRGQNKRELEPAQKLRLRERSVAERANSRLKDGILGRQVWVKGHRKVSASLMFGVLVLTVDALFRLAT